MSIPYIIGFISSILGAVDIYKNRNYSWSTRSQGGLKIIVFLPEQFYHRRPKHVIRMLSQSND